MIELLVVCRMGGPIDLKMDGDDASRYATVKARALGYCQVMLCRRLGGGAFSGRMAPLGTVRSPADGARLLAALSREFPNHSFATTTVPYGQVDEALYMPLLQDNMPLSSVERGIAALPSSPPTASVIGARRG